MSWPVAARLEVAVPWRGSDSGPARVAPLLWMQNGHTFPWVVAALLLSTVNSGRVTFAFHANLVGHQSLQENPLKLALCNRRGKTHFRRSCAVCAGCGRPRVSDPGPQGGSAKNGAHMLTASLPQLRG